MKKRIVHVVSTPGVSGVTAVIRFLLLRMVDQGSEGYLVHYAENDEFCESLSRSGVKVINIKQLPIWLKALRPYWIIQNMKRIFSGISPELIHAHSFDADILSARAAIGTNFPLVVTCHSFSYIEWVKKHLRQYERWEQNISRYVCVSKMLEKQLSKILPQSENRIKTIYNAPDISFFNPVSTAERAECRKKLGIFPNEVAITCVANYHPVKGQEVLAEAFARLAIMQNIRLILVGNEGHIYSGNSIKQKVIDIFKSSGALERCYMIEDCTDARPILAASDIYVQPSHQEGLSVALGEALACSLPAVVTAVGGNTEVISDGYSGFIVPPADPEKMSIAIEELVTNEAMRKKMGNNSYQFAAKNLHPSVIFNAYSDLYDALLQ
jgi:glycosyltransferase involved in cell wall biosynthesis